MNPIPNEMRQRILKDRPDVAQKRAEWKLMQLGLNPKKPVFLDETSAKTNMTRLYGRALKGQRLVDKTPHGHWVNTPLVCGLKHDRIVAPHAFVGAMNKKRFLDYLKRHLLPVLKKGDVVIMDNLSSHKGKYVETLLASKGRLLCTCRHTAPT
ncbi:MAG: transposase [Planctomycetaceae bacterium]|nr:transposase [Planctomycetaceae bacterium]